MAEASLQWKVDTLRQMVAATPTTRFAPRPDTNEKAWFIDMMNDGLVSASWGREADPANIGKFMFMDHSGPEVFYELQVSEKGKKLIHDHDFRQQSAAHFKILDAKMLLKWDDKSLAEWQSHYKPDQAQWILADQEWKRRAGVSARKIAIAALVVSLLTFALAALGYIFPKNTQNALGTKTTEPPAPQTQSPAQPKQ